MPTREELLQADFQRIQAEAQTYLRAQILGNVKLQREVDIANDLMGNIAEMLVTSGQTTVTETTKQIKTDFVRVFGQLAEVFATQTANALYSSARQLGAEGAGFGSLGRQLGRTFGGSLGQSIDKRFSAGSMASEMRLFQRMGEFAGDVMLQTIAMQIEGFRMVGAKMAPVMTAGFGGEETDYKQLGIDMTLLANQLVLDTAKTVGEIATMGSKLSQLGMGFRESGAQATQYTFALANVKNLKVDTAYGLIEQAVRQHGQDWQTVAQAMEQFTAATAMYQQQAKSGNDAMAQSFSSLENLVGMYNQVRTSIGTTGLDMMALSSIFLGFVNVSKEMGGRTDMITQQIAGIMRSLFSIQQGSLGDIMNRSNFIITQLRSSQFGREVINEAEPVAKKMGLDINQHLPIVLDQMFAGKGGEAMAEKFALAMSESLYEASRGAGPYGGVQGGPTEAFNAVFNAVNSVLKMPVRSFITMQNTGAKISDLRKQGWTSEDISTELATGGMPGLDADTIIGRSREMSKSALSVQQEFNTQMALTTATDLSLHGANVDTLAKVLPALREHIKVSKSKRAAYAMTQKVVPPAMTPDPMTSPSIISSWFAKKSQEWTYMSMKAAMNLFNSKGSAPGKQVLINSSSRQVDGGVEQQVLTSTAP